MRKPSIKRGPASTYEADNERIVEISGTGGKGALLAVREIDGILYIQTYRLSPNVVVRSEMRQCEFNTIEQIKRAVPAWFEPGARRFFNSRVCETVYPGGYFVTSERYSGEAPRLYSVRQCYRDSNGKPAIRTIGEFQQHATRGKAMRAARTASMNWSAGLEPPVS